MRESWRGPLDELLAAHLEAFRMRHSRVLADAGPGLLGGDRAVEHWTFGYATDAVERCLAELARLLAGQPNAAAARPAVDAYVARIVAELEADYVRSSASEYGLRPSRAALQLAVQRMRGQTDAAFAALARGRLPDGRPIAAAGGCVLCAFLRRLGTGPSLLLVAALVLLTLFGLPDF